MISRLGALYVRVIALPFLVSTRVDPLEEGGGGVSPYATEWNENVKFGYSKRSTV